MIYIKYIVALILLILPHYVLAHSCSCISEKDPRSWLEDGLNGFDFDGGPFLKLRKFEVAGTRAASAIDLLGKQSFVELSDDKQLTFFLDHMPNHVDGFKPYLVRGVIESIYNSRMTAVWYSEKKLLDISSFALGEGGQWRFAPLVVYLPAKPEMVWVRTVGAL